MKNLDLNVEYPEDGIIRAETRRWKYVFNKQVLCLTDIYCYTCIQKATERIT